MEVNTLIVRSFRNWILPIGMAIVLNAFLVSFIPGLVSPVLERKIEKKDYAGFNLISIQPPMHAPVNQHNQKRLPVDNKVKPATLEKTIQQVSLMSAMNLSLQLRTTPPDSAPEVILPDIEGFLVPKVPSEPQVAARFQSPLTATVPQKIDNPIIKHIYTMDEIDKPLTPLVQMPPSYPIHAKRRRIEGWVDIQYIINKKGRVEELKIIAASPKGVFENSVQQTVLSWRFSSGTVNGVPAKIRASQRLRFRLNQ